MNKKTLVALLDSIRKWEDIARGEGEGDWRSRNCALCQIYQVHEMIHDCENCPIKKKVGLTGCNGTPYELWTNHQRIYHKVDLTDFGVPYIIQCPECVEIAEAEVAFLKSLLGEGEG